jgi:hypothetical protein
LTERQHQFLSKEIRETLCQKFDVRIFIYFGVGIDGHTTNSKTHEFGDLDREIVQAIKNADYVISDNCLWPFHFRRDTILLGHFLWHDVLDTLSVSNSSKFSQNLLAEKKLLESAKSVIGLRNFSFGSICDLAENRLVHLPNYYPNKSSKKIQDVIWYATGTTGLNQIKVSSPLDCTIVKKESFELQQSPYLPLAIVGRPGLGTIRDCIEYQVPFCPVFSGSDIELENNSAVLKRYSQHSTILKTIENTLEAFTVEREEFLGMTSWKEFSRMIE